MLSAKELFKYRTGLDNTVPQKGGEKDFMPDGSWLQGKRIEKFNEERKRVLEEPRVLRSLDLVKGEWKPDVSLVQLCNELGHFWEHMGFDEKKKKWLYPEEALFLMETNTLEVWFQSMPLSIQEGYMLFLNDHVTLEYYQVYAHLRRVGYVVQRHQGRFEITKYERRIGLDKYVSKKKAKSDRRKRRAEATGTSSSSAVKVAKVDAAVDIDKGPDNGINATAEEENAASEETIFSNISLETDSEKEVKRNEEKEIESSNSFTVSLEPDTFPVTEKDSETVEKTCGSSAASSKWNFNEIRFPNFGEDGETVVIARPENSELVPQKLALSCHEYVFEKKMYINTKKSKKLRNDEENEDVLEFSYPEIMAGKYENLKSCKNWASYKQEVRRQRDIWDRNVALPHLYGKEVQPLVLPEHAHNTESILDQLYIIKEEEFMPKKLASTKKPDVLPHFDVYAPNTKFKKTNPGVPDNRICVSRYSDTPPDLGTVTAMRQYLQDDVQLQWAVVDNGDIAFFTVDDFLLQRDIVNG